MAVSILLARALVQAVESADVSRADFLSAAGFDAERLESDHHIDLEEYDSLIGHALDATSDSALGLHIMNDPAVAATYNVTSYLVIHSSCLRKAIETLQRYHRLISDRPYWVVEEDEDTATIRYEGDAGPPRCRRYRSEFTVTAMYKMLQYFVRNARPLVVAFDYAEPPYRHEYEAAFEGTARFDQPFTGIVISRELLDATHPNSDAELHSTLRAQAEKRLAQIEGKTTYADRVCDFIEQHPSQKDMSSVARALGMSPRSLRRRLAEEDVPYRAIVDRALASLATRLLVDERSSIQEIAYRLDFSDPSTFCRAFKRWTGSTPKQYVAMHANSGPRSARASDGPP